MCRADNPHALCNDFKVERHGRHEAIKRFRESLRGKRQLVERARCELAGKRLGCWCGGQACHGDIWVELVECSACDLEVFFAGARSAQSENWGKRKRSFKTVNRPKTPRRKDGLRRVVVLDPGHGGVDPGTVGVTGSYEKHITLAVAKAAKKVMEKEIRKVTL